MQSIAYFVGYLVICWLAADFLSGFFHWLEDRYARADWPFIGDLVAKPNELHHAQPTAFLDASYWHRNWVTMALALPFFALVFPSPWCLIFLFASQANEVHAWSHQRCNDWIRALQATGVLQSPREHGTHHKAPFDVRYCVLSNWLNPILDRSRFWFAAERILFALTGLRPKDDIISDRPS